MSILYLIIYLILLGSLVERHHSIIFEFARFLCNESHRAPRGRAWRERHSAHVPRAFCQILLSGYTRGITSTPDVSRARDSAVCLSSHVMPLISRLRDICACPRRRRNRRVGINTNNLNSTSSRVSFCREKNLNYLSIKFIFK